MFFGDLLQVCVGEGPHNNHERYRLAGRQELRTPFAPLLRPDLPSHLSGECFSGPGLAFFGVVEVAQQFFR